MKNCGFGTAAGQPYFVTTAKSNTYTKPSIKKTNQYQLLLSYINKYCINC